MIMRKFLWAAAVPLVAGLVGCSGADNPKIASAPAPPPPPPEAAKQNLPKNKFMENDLYKQGMEKMQRAQSGK